jgi:dihydrofolate reductase
MIKRRMMNKNSQKLFLFMMVSLDGFFEGKDHDLSWHHVDEEFNRFAIEQLDETGTLLFGKKTYELMENFWPSSQGLQDDPETAQRMNTLPKVVVSTTLQKVTETDHWQHVQLINNSIEEKIKKLKKEAEKPIALLGSNQLLVSLTKLGLVDEFRIMINPVVIGEGTRLFYGLDIKFDFTLTKIKRFNCGNVLLYYQPQYS